MTEPSDRPAPAPTLWVPPADARTSTSMGRYLGWLERERRLTFEGYEDLWRWSVDDLEAVWSSVWSFFDIRAAEPYDAVLRHPAMPGTEWFPGAHLNYAEHALRTTGDGLAVIARSHSREERRLSWDDLADLVGRCRSGLRRRDQPG